MGNDLKNVETGSLFTININDDDDDLEDSGDY